MLDRRTFVKAGLGALVPASLGACALAGTDGNDAGGEGKGGATLHFYIFNPLAIDPYNTQESEGRQVQSALFDTLCAYDWDRRELVGRAAETWGRNTDSTEFTFHLKPGATFHNGEPVTAQSFKRAWERICDPSMDPPSGIRYHLDPVLGAREMAEGAAREIVGVQALDELTLQVTLVSPMADFPYVCSHPSLAPVPQAAIDDPQAFLMAPIGNGPFRMDGEWVPDQRISVVRHDGYHGEPSTLGRVEFRILQTPGAAFQEFEAGHVDFTPIAAGRFGEVSMSYGVSEDGYTVTPGAQVLTGSECTSYFLCVNCEDEVTRDLDVRRALSLAIDRQHISDVIFGGTYPVADGVIPPILLDGQAGAWEDCRHDKDAARRLLDERHPADASGRRDLRLRLAYNSGGGHEDIMAMVAADLQAVGIQVEQSTSEWAAFHDVLESGSFQLARFGWVADYPTLDDFLYPLFHSTASSNYSRYANPEVDAALAAARQVADEDERKRAYRDAHALVGRDMPVIPLLFHSHNHVGSDRVGRLTYDPQGRAHFEDATMA